MIFAGALFASIFGAPTAYPEVVEELVFEVGSSDLDRFLALDREVWTKGLERLDGYLRKEVRVSPKPAGKGGREVRLQVYWESFSAWHSIPKATLQKLEKAFSEQMGGGESYRLVSVRGYEIVTPPPMRVELSELTGPTETVSVRYDPVYHKGKSFEAGEFRPMVRAWMDERGLNDEETWLFFECSDGYAPAMPASRFFLADGPVPMLAVRDLGAADGSAWIPIKKGDATLSPEPFYLVWKGGDGAAARDTKKFPWPYAMTALRFVVEGESNP